MAAGWRGLDEMLGNLERLEDVADEGMDLTTREAGEVIMTDVRASRPGKGVPVDTGALRASADVSGPDQQGAVELSFGGPAAPYALAQHERLDYSHTVGESRYLVRGWERFKQGGLAAAQRALLEQTVSVAFQNGRFNLSGSFPSAPLT